MSSPLLTRYSTPAERFRGCRCAYGFETADLVQRNGGTITGAPTVDFGAVLDGTNDYITFDVSSYETDSVNFSAVLEVLGDFSPTADATIVFFDSTGNNYRLEKLDNANADALRLTLGGTQIADIAYATWSAAWSTTSKNTVVIYGTSGDTSVILNGTLILDSDATAWAPAETATFTVGAATGGGSLFGGTFYLFKVFKELLTDAEAEDYCDDSTYAYRNSSICYLPMTMETHDPANVRTLDVSGNGNHFTFGDGVTADRFPRKLATRGYAVNLDGGITEYFGRNMFFDPNADFTMCYHIDSRNTSTFYFWCHRDGAGDGTYHVFVSGASSRMVYQGITDTENGQQPINKTFGFVADVSANLGQFVDGVLTGESDISGQTIDVTDPSFFIGRRNGDLATVYEGYVYQFQVWDRVLTPMQVADWHIRAMKQVNHV